MKQKTSSYNSIEKAMRVLMAFSVDQSTWGVRELSAHLGFSPATVQRILQTLKRFAFVDQDRDTRQYRFGNIFPVHGYSPEHPHGEPAALPHMKQLMSRTQETVNLNVIDGMSGLHQRR